MKGLVLDTSLIDIWIAAVALECGLPVATGDRHFQHVEGLEVWLWE